MMIRIFLVFFFLFGREGLLAQQGYEKAIRQFLEIPEYKNAQVGILIADAKTGSTIYELNSNKLMIPASVMKLVTTGAALEILGPDYRFQTRIGYSGKIKNGTLKGDLIIIGGGDPALGSEYFQDHYFFPHFLEVWARSIKNAGIKKVEGNLVMDNSLYDSENIAPTWIWEDMGNYYGAATNALSVYDNLFRITFRSPAKAGMPTEIVSMSPKVDGLEWTNEVLSSDINRDLAYVFGSPIDGRRVIRGTIPKNRKMFTIKASNPFPEKLLADDLMVHLANAGIFVSGDRITENVMAQAFRQIAVFESPSLSDIINILNVESINFFTEQLVKQIAAEKTGIGTREAGLKLISGFWESKGLDINQLFMEDGSGLSRFNAVSPAFMSDILHYMKSHSPFFTVFYESLPAAGKGTMMFFDPQKFSGNSFRLKSGSMTRVRCYAGYMLGDSGSEFIVTFFVNHFSGTHSKLIAEFEKILLEIRKN
jgi:serine-type D-Ala-D-Ala carboxypeptidase/endopeptidase (penicillin-binding protein 4)